MIMIKKLFTASLAAAIAVTLAGCSSGSNTSAASDSVVPTTSVTQAAESAASAPAASESLTESVDDPAGHTIPVDSAPTASMAAGDSYDTFIKLADYKGLDLSAYQMDSSVAALDIGAVIKTPAIAAFQEVAAGSEVLQYPEQLLKEWEDYEVNSYTSEASEAGTDYSSYISQLGISESDIEDYAKNSCKAQLVARAIISKENITEDSQVYQDALSAFKDTYNGKTPAETVSDGILQQCEADSTLEIMEAELVIQNSAK